jgi:hypothetical protein
MSLTLSGPIAEYFAADIVDGNALAQCFTEDAIVTDESQSHQGRDAIRDWKTAASAEYNYVSEPILVDEVGDRTVVTCHVSGDFPGSPVDLRYEFEIAGDKIASLTIS